MSVSYQIRLIAHGICRGTAVLCPYRLCVHLTGFDITLLRICAPVGRWAQAHKTWIWWAMPTLHYVYIFHALPHGFL